MSTINSSVVEHIATDIHRTANADNNEVTKSNIGNDQSLRKIEQQAVENTLQEDLAKDKKEVISPAQLEKVAQQLQQFVGDMNKGLEFLVDKDSGRDVIKVIDRNSGDLIKQYPSEEVLSLVAKLSEAAGSFINEQV